VLPNGDGLQDVLIVQVHTDSGVTGIGEAHTMPLALRAIIDAPVSQSASQGLKQLLLGEDPRNIDYLWDKMFDHTAVLGRRGVVLHAISAIDIALWDILGKHLGVPVFQLLGGRRRDSVLAYASDLMPETERDLLASAARLTERGFRAMKFGWGGLGADQPRDRRLLAQLRSVVGDEVDLMLDLGVPVPFDTALLYAQAAADEGLAFLEEPLSTDDLGGYARLTRISPVPIATGEKETTRFSFIDLMDRGGLRIVQPDLARAGGITEARRIAAAAETRGCAVIPHSWATDILLAATLHFLASIKEARYLEYNVMDNPLRTHLLVEPITPDAGGRVAVPTGPGLGIELNLETMDRYRWEPAPGLVRPVPVGS
jgi:L-alanine-DL-glutamate epimerase-like enolase superfamily enzyme